MHDIQITTFPLPSRFIFLTSPPALRLVELGKLQIKTEQRDKRENQLSSSVRKVKNKSGIIESRIFTCNECAEEFCNGKVCLDFNYDLYTRIAPKAPIVKTNSQQQISTTKILAELNQKSIDSGSGGSTSKKSGIGGGGRRSIRRKSKTRSKSAEEDDGNQSGGGGGGGGAAGGGGKKKTKKSSRSKSPGK